MILIGLGSNLTTDDLPTSKAVLEEAIDMLSSEDTKIVKGSRFYETEPVPASDQPWYVNAVVHVESNLSAPLLLERLHDVEQKLGRTRRERWEARIIDLDLLSYNGEILPSKEKWLAERENSHSDILMVPHARMHQRSFVLLPLRDIEPNWIHPVFDKKVLELIDELETDEIVRVL